ncbi:putative Aspartic-type endopeptidase [Scedosporium apiospermum]|uniref:Putative Aspartic-type endopeptidase n=1 Tax=Pseudallescheria apiosperma TaxID=563466 RepID=A0A084FWP8_PSEDA|nr:putative Aspartic-type endopeptidase [Scedosporium apiospermum]KEZ39510.1 putative Aspartic-type endopeptidase [Scedosporium apiospermum]
MWLSNPQSRILCRVRAIVLLLACQTWTVASAACAPKPLSTKIRNVTLSNRLQSRGIALAVGTPEQEFAFLPQWPLNNTLIYGTNGFCMPPAPNTQNGCTVWRGGQYDQLASDTRKRPTIGAYPDDNAPYPSMNFISDTLKLTTNVSLDDFPMGIARSDWGQEGYHPMMAVGLGSNSTLLNTLKAAGKIASRSWSMFYGLTGADANAQLDGSFILGGYDRAKVKGGGYTERLSTNPNCRSQILVTITDISLNFPNGTDASLFPKGLSSSIPACLVPDYPALMKMPRKPCFDNFERLTNVTLSKRSWGVAYSSMLYCKGDEPYRGDLTFTLQSGLSIRIPNDQLVVPELTIDCDTGALHRNSSAQNLVILPPQDDNENDISQLGRQFLSSAYVMANLDAGEFTIWESNPTSNEDLVAIDTNGTEVSDFCAATTPDPASGETSPDSASSEGSVEQKDGSKSMTPVIIAGIAVSGFVFLAGVGAALFCLLRHWKRRRRRERAAAVDSSPSPPPEYSKKPDNTRHEKQEREMAPSKVNSRVMGPSRGKPSNAGTCELGVEKWETTKYYIRS